MKAFKLGICQIKTTENKLQNLHKAWAAINRVKSKGAEVVAFGEMFTCPYNLNMFPKMCETIGKQEITNNSILHKSIEQLAHNPKSTESEVSNFLDHLMATNCPTYLFLKAVSRIHDMLVVGGSLSEKVDDKLYNTCYVFDKGEEIGKHRKVHMFDVDVPGKVTFKESSVLAPGDAVTVVKTRFGTFGIAICYDIRFASFAMAMRQLGADLLFYPSVFNPTTGPRHFLLSGRARAIDTQCYVVLSSNATYPERPDFLQSYGHSALVDCDGKIVENLEHEEGEIVQDVDLEFLKEIRRGLPYTSDQIRSDLYELVVKNK